MLRSRKIPQFFILLVEPFIFYIQKFSSKAFSFRYRSCFYFFFISIFFWVQKYFQTLFFTVFELFYFRYGRFHQKHLLLSSLVFFKTCVYFFYYLFSFRYSVFLKTFLLLVIGGFFYFWVQQSLLKRFPFFFSNLFSVIFSSSSKAFSFKYRSLVSKSVFFQVQKSFS